MNTDHSRCPGSSLGMDVAHSYDPLAIAALEDPSALLIEARKHCPVTQSDQHGGFWALFRYEDVGHVARNPVQFSSNHGLGIPDHGMPIRWPPIEMDPPKHIQYRAPLMEWFSPGSVARLEPAIREVVTGLIDAFCETGTADLATQLTIPLPCKLIPAWLNLPPDDAGQFHDWATRLLGPEQDYQAGIDMFSYFWTLCSSRRVDPQDPASDFTSLLLTLVIEGERIGVEDAALTMCTLVSAGLDTTANAGSYILHILHRRHDLREILRTDRTLIPQAIEEFVRYISPVAMETRTTMTDVEIGGIPIPPGRKVLVNWLAANRDPAEFDDPHEIDLHRQVNRHYGFGAGPHRCLGAHLARIELRILLEEVLDRIPDFTVLDEAVERYGGITRGVTSLPATFSPSPARDVTASFS